jgi:DNA-binding IscR family transcriptional regulator
MGDVRNAIADILDNTSLADITKRQKAIREKLSID